MGKKVAILIEEGYQDQEFWYPYYRMKEEGFEVVVVGPEKKEYKSKYGYPIQADRSVNEVSSADFDFLVIPGGKAPEKLRRNRAILKFVQDFAQQKKLIAAICHGPQVLISAGVVKGKRMTCWSGVVEELKEAGGTYENKEVVVDRNIITSRQPSDLPAFCKAIVVKAKV